MAETIKPRRIMMLDEAFPSQDDDFLPISQVIPETRGTPTQRRKTNRMTWSQFTARIREVIDEMQHEVGTDLQAKSERLQQLSDSLEELLQGSPVTAEALAQALRDYIPKQSYENDAHAQGQSINQLVETLNAQSDKLQTQTNTLKTQNDTLTAQQNTLKTQQDTLTAQQQALSAAQASLATQQSTIQTLLDQIAARKQPITLPDISIPPSALITITAKPITVTRPCMGVKVGDTLTLTPKNWPAVYGLRSYSIAANDSVTIEIYCPTLSVGGPTLVLGALAHR